MIVAVFQAALRIARNLQMITKCRVQLQLFPAQKINRLWRASLYPLAMTND